MAKKTERVIFMLKPDFVYQCECGAITLTFGEKEYYVSKENLQTFFPNLDLDGIPTQKTYACNHCVNHWGLDLCGCGSGFGGGRGCGGFAIVILGGPVVAFSAVCRREIRSRENARTMRANPRFPVLACLFGNVILVGGVVI